MTVDSTNQNNENNESTKIETLQPILQIALVEWNQTIGEAMSNLEGEKDIIKQTIIITLTAIAGLLYFLGISSNTLTITEKFSLSPLFIIFPAIYLLLSIYSFYQTYYRYMISRYWLEEFFPKIEKLLTSVPILKQEVDKIFPRDTLPFQIIRWQSFYRNESSLQMVMAIAAYRGIPLFLGAPISIVYLIFLIRYKNYCIDKYVSFWIQITLGSVILAVFVVLLCILLWGIKRMLKQAKQK